MDSSASSTPPDGPPDGENAAPLGPENRWRVLAVICSVFLIIAVDMTVLHIATPAIAADLRPSGIELLWIVDVYALVLAPLLVLSATLGDRLGRKRVLIVGMVIFGLASLLAAFAWSPGSLIAARVLQGVGGAAIAPATMAIIRDAFPDRDERARAIGVWSATMALGSAAGPVIGGLLIDAWWWGAVFLINVPLLLIALPLARRVLPESRNSDPPPWDPASVITIAAGVLLLAWGIKEGARHGFAGEPLAALAGSALLITWFARRQLRRENPTLDVRLFGSRLFRVAVVGVLLSVFAIVGLQLLFAQYLQLVAGFTATQASLWMVPLVLSTIAGAYLGPRLLTRIGPRRTISGGFALGALSLVPVLWVGQDPTWLLPPAFALLGASLEASLIGANDLIFGSVDVDRAGQASAIEETAYELGGGLGVAVLGSIAGVVSLQTIGGDAGGLLAREGAAAGELVRQVRTSLSEALLVAEEVGGPAGRAVADLARSGFVDGFHAAVAVAIGLTAIAGLLSWVRIGDGRDGQGGDAAPEHD